MPIRVPAINSKKANGLTLSEILIALAILGIVMSVAIPTLATQRENVAKKAVFKETLKTLEDIMREGFASGDYDINTVTRADYFLSKINAVKTCRNTVSDGCWDAIKGGPLPEGGEAGFVLHNGVVLTGLDGALPATDGNTAYIDWNGTKPPNQLGEDQLWITMCFGELFDCGSVKSGTLSYNTGMSTPPMTTPADVDKNRNLYKSIYGL
jgi:prepilin-type N-terminal cleavage/methylation domain-containing protein